MPEHKPKDRARKVTVSFACPPAARDRLEDIAWQCRLSLSALVSAIVDRYIAESHLPEGRPKHEEI